MTLNPEPSYCDGVPLARRSEEFQNYYLPDIAKATGDAFTIADILQSQRILDIGCGSGALADAVQKLGYTGTMIGVDPNGPYTGDDDAYPLYEQLIYKDVRNDAVLEQINQFEYDTILAIGLPPHVVKFILQNRDKFRLKEKGHLVVVSDDAHIAPEEFQVFHGKYSVDKNIFVYQKKNITVEEIAQGIESRDRPTQFADQFYNRTLSPREVGILRDSCQNQVLLDLGAGALAEGMARFASDRLRVAHYIAVDRHHQPQLGQYEHQAGFESKKQDALLFLATQPDNLAHITINGLDDSILPRDQKTNRTYIQALLKEIARVTAQNGLVFGVNTPFLPDLQNVGFHHVEGTSVYGVWRKGGESMKSMIFEELERKPLPAGLEDKNLVHVRLRESGQSRWIVSKRPRSFHRDQPDEIKRLPYAYRFVEIWDRLHRASISVVDEAWAVSDTEVFMTYLGDDESALYGTNPWVQLERDIRLGEKMIQPEDRLLVQIPLETIAAASANLVNLAIQAGIVLPDDGAFDLRVRPDGRWGAHCS